MPLSIRTIADFFFYSPVSFLFLLPFLVISGMYNPYEYPKFLFTLGYIQLYTIYRVFTYVTLRTPLVKKDPFSFLVVGLLAWLALTNLLGLDPYTSFLGSSFRHQGFILYLSLGIFSLLLHALSFSDKKRLFHVFAKVSIVSFLLLCALTIFHALRFFIFSDYGVPMLGSRFAGTLGNPNFLGGYIVMLLPIALYGITLLHHLPTKKRLFFQILLGILSFGTLVLTDSKSSLLAFLLITGIYGKISWKNKWQMENGKWKILLVIPVVLILLVILFTFRFSPWDNRGIIWSQGIAAIQQRPLLGYGQENFALIIKDIGFFHADNAHNIFIELAVSSGLVGVFLFIIIFYLSFKHASYPIRLGLIAFLITASLNPLSITQLTLFWFFLGFEENT